MDECMHIFNRMVLTYYASTIVRERRSNSNPMRTTIIKRVKSILGNGLYLCGRRYSFLAYSAKNLRDRLHLIIPKLNANEPFAHILDQVVTLHEEQFLPIDVRKNKRWQCDNCILQIVPDGRKCRRQN